MNVSKISWNIFKSLFFNFIIKRSVKNKIIIITGSTQGSGAETAKLLASRGAKGITICGRNEKNGKKVKSEIESLGTECIYVKAETNT